MVENNNEEDLLLKARDVKTYFMLDEGTVRAVDGVSFELKRGATLGIVGESGCGKSVLVRSINRIVAPPGETVEGSIDFYRQDESGFSEEPVDLVSLNPNGKEIRKIRGGEITMIFQEPMASFSPVHTIGDQITESLLEHQDVTKEEARATVVQMLEKVGIPNAEQRIDEYSFRLSGGMRQRAMIAMALCSNPTLLIADEPTTALDVTTQAQILGLISSLQKEFGMAMIIISHNLGVVAKMTEEIMVMYLGKVVERGSAQEVFHKPIHPYTQELLKSIPRMTRTPQEGRLTAIKGSVPSWRYRPSGCNFMPECDGTNPDCATEEPILVEETPGHWVSYCAPCRETHGCKWFPRDILDSDGGIEE